jgi:hypothetical protein
MSVKNASKKLKVSHMMHIGTANHVRKTTHEITSLLGSVLIAVTLASRAYHIPEYVPMYWQHLPTDVPSNRA